jgi:hypothetical protein
MLVDWFGPLKTRKLLNGGDLKFLILLTLLADNVNEILNCSLSATVVSLTDAVKLCAANFSGSSIIIINIDIFISTNPCQS